MEKILQLLTIAGVTISINAFALQKSTDYWTNDSGTIWKNGTDELCWKNAHWTSTSLHGECDILPKQAEEQVPAIIANDHTATHSVISKINLASDAFFDFNKFNIKNSAKKNLDELVEKLKNLNLESLIAVGHTDSIGTSIYNKKLSEQRAVAIKQYLVSKGIDTNRIQIIGKGEEQPIANNQTNQGRSKNRRVEIEVIGTTHQH